MTDTQNPQEISEKVVNTLMNYCESGQEKRKLLDIISAEYIMNTIEKDQFSKL